MITDLLHIDRSLVCLDTETTGLNVEADRIVELAFEMFYSDDTPVKRWRSIINPGIPIPPESIRVHGITDEDVAGRPQWAAFAGNIAKRFTNVDFMGMNIRYDLQIIAAEMQRAGVEWSYRDACILDAYRLESLGEPRGLSDLYRRRCGKEPVDAHSALADVRMTSEVIEAQLTQFEKLPHSLQKLHEMQWPGAIGTEGKFKMVDGVPTVNFGQKYREKDMRTVDRGFWKWIMNNEFSVETKKIAQDALNGVWPK